MLERRIIAFGGRRGGCEGQAGWEVEEGEGHGQDESGVGKC